MIKVTESVVERHMKRIDFMEGTEMTDLNPEKLREIATRARKARMDRIKSVFENDPVYAHFAASMSSAAFETIRFAVSEALSKGGGLKDLDGLIQFLVVDSLVFSYDILQDCMSEDLGWWDKQLAKTDDQINNPETNEKKYDKDGYDKNGVDADGFRKPRIVPEEYNQFPDAKPS